MLCCCCSHRASYDWPISFKVFSKYSYTHLQTLGPLTWLHPNLAELVTRASSSSFCALKGSKYLVSNQFVIHIYPAIANNTHHSTATASLWLTVSCWLGSFQVEMCDSVNVKQDVVVKEQACSGCLLRVEKRLKMNMDDSLKARK